MRQATRPEELAGAALVGVVVSLLAVRVAKRIESRTARLPYAVRRRWRVWRLVRKVLGTVVLEGDEGEDPWLDTLDKARVLTARKQYLCSAQSVSYANTNPLLLVRGSGSRMMDESGTSYLDTRNNVPHVGHAHPVVASAVADQIRTLNTNTRYLHPNVCELARRLVETMPAKSELRETGVVFLVNSGSEANDLALRICRAYTKRQGTIVVERAYHGHTVATLGLSPYKYLHPSFDGRGKPDEVEAIRAPDVYRGNATKADAPREMRRAIDALQFRGHELGCFFVESGMSVAGVIIAPEGYMREAYRVVREAGGLCVADEVQTGLGRTGNSWYAFESHCVVPDIVTLGKPLGNGVPLAAVVAVGRCADAFAKGPEYFNTFGGNPVCCAAGLAVLEVLRDEGLTRNAAAVGDYLKRGLIALSDLPPDCPVRVGDVRGSGLFLGADLVTDLSTKAPATTQASLICSNLVQKHHILTTLDGQFDNILVVKPPMCFSMRDADIFLTALRVELLYLATLDPAALASASHTPT